MFDSYSYTNDGVICNECFEKYLKKIGETRKQALLNLKCMSKEQVKSVLLSSSKIEELLAIFKPNKNILELIEIDEEHKLWGVPIKEGFSKKVQKVYSFEDIVGYNIDENKEQVTKRKGTLGRGIVGGLLAGPIGVLVGGATAKKVTKEQNTKATIQIKVRSSYTPITIVAPNNIAKENVITAIEHMLTQTSTNNLNTGTADELLKYKELLDNGIITQDEFEHKKKQLLNL